METAKESATRKADFERSVEAMLRLRTAGRQTHGNTSNVNKGDVSLIRKVTWSCHCCCCYCDCCCSCTGPADDDTDAGGYTGIDEDDDIVAAGNTGAG